MFCGGCKADKGHDSIRIADVTHPVSCLAGSCLEADLLQHCFADLLCGKYQSAVWKDDVWSYKLKWYQKSGRSSSWLTPLLNSRKILEGVVFLPIVRKKKIHNLSVVPQLQGAKIPSCGILSSTAKHATRGKRISEAAEINSEQWGEFVTGRFWEWLFSSIRPLLLEEDSTVKSFHFSSS